MLKLMSNFKAVTVRQTAQSPAPPVYHDGLIPTETTQHCYPEVVPGDHDTHQYEKTYPEVAAAGSSVTPSAVSLPARIQPQAPHQGCSDHCPHHVPQAHHTHHAPHHAAGIPRPSGVHSLRQAWSETDGQEYQERRPWWRRPIIWVVLIALAIIIALAGILGGVASGSIKTAFDKDQSQPQSSSSPTDSSDSSNSNSNSNSPTATTTTASTTTSPTSTALPTVSGTPSCPASNKLLYTPTTQKTRTYRILCDHNFPSGDGSTDSAFGSQLTKFDITVASLEDCIDRCAAQDGCVAAVFRPAGAQAKAPSQDCWLKNALTYGNAENGVNSAVLWREEEWGS